MNVPSTLDWMLLSLWPTGLFFAIWGIVIGLRRDRLARRVAKLYGTLGLAIQTPLFLAWFGVIGVGYNETSVVNCIVGCIPVVLSIVAIVLGLRPAKEAESSETGGGRGV